MFSLFFSYRCRVSLKVSPTLRAPWWSNHTEAENFVVPSARRTSMPFPDSEPVTTTSGLKEYLFKICVFFREAGNSILANQKLTNHEGFILGEWQCCDLHAWGCKHMRRHWTNPSGAWFVTQTTLKTRILILAAQSVFGEKGRNKKNNTNMLSAQHDAFPWHLPLTLAGT